MRSFKAREDDGDARIMKELGVDDRFAHMDELIFDWMADTGDGGHSTYAIARALAQPCLNMNVDARLVHSGDKTRWSSPGLGFLILGGDLCYPDPQVDTYDRRLFVPFEYAWNRHPVTLLTTYQLQARRWKRQMMNLLLWRFLVIMIGSMAWAPS